MLHEGYLTWNDGYSFEKHPEWSYVAENNSDVNDCFLLFQMNGHGVWRSENCSQAHLYICEYSPTGVCENQLSEKLGKLQCMHM